MTIQTVPVELTGCSRAAAHLAVRLGELHLAGPVDLLAAALPDTATARTATTLGDAWVARLRSLSSDVDAYAQRLTDAAASYVGADEATSTELRGATRWEL
ncbi:MAG: hypothetical protein ABI181_11110 [Mycobacteriaceae bacterium]